MAQRHMIPPSKDQDRTGQVSMVKLAKLLCLNPSSLRTECQPLENLVLDPLCQMEGRVMGPKVEALVGF